jgi:hypothetical protein
VGGNKSLLCLTLWSPLVVVPLLSDRMAEASCSKMGLGKVKNYFPYFPNINSPWPIVQRRHNRGHRQHLPRGNQKRQPSNERVQSNNQQSETSNREVLRNQDRGGRDGDGSEATTRPEANEEDDYINTVRDRSVEMSRGVWRRVSMGVEDGRRPPALRAAHICNGRMAVSGVARTQGVEG